MSLTERFPKAGRMLCATVVLMLGGCGTTPPSHFYLLEPMQQSRDTPPAGSGGNALHIGVGPIQFAQYLDRSQIVTSLNESQVRLAETHRWAEPLQHNFARVLAENLSILLATDAISLYPSRNWSDIDYQVPIHVWQFHADGEGEVTLIANWSIRTNQGSDLLTMSKSVLTARVPPSASYAEITSAMSAVAEMLSREIAEALARISHQPA